MVAKADRCDNGPEEDFSHFDNSERRSFELMSSSELARRDCRIKYLIDKVIPLGEPGLLTGRSKSLKTTLAIDLATSVASCTPFLGHFPVKKPGRVAIFTAESGEAVVKETASRICRSKGMELNDLDGLLWSFEVPQIGSQVRLIENTIEDNGLDLLIIDPAYFALGEVADNYANPTKMATVLRPLSEACHTTNCSIMLVAHNKKVQTNDPRPRFPIPSIFDVHGAGLDQWARYGLLIGPRREWDCATGRHSLWMNQMGSAVPSNLWGVDVREGRLDDPGGRVWDVAVHDGEETRCLDASAKTPRKPQTDDQVRNNHIEKLRAVLLGLPEGGTESSLRAKARLNDSDFDTALAALSSEGSVEPCKVRRGNGQTYDGIRLVERNTAA